MVQSKRRPLCRWVAKVNKHKSYCVVDDDEAIASAIITLDCTVLCSSSFGGPFVRLSLFEAAAATARQQTWTEFKTDRKMQVVATLIQSYAE